MRTVAVFNDTAPSRHFGCEAVMAAIESNVATRGGRIAYRHPVNTPWEADKSAMDAIENADVVLVNGEGTIHHAKPAAADLARIGPYCAARRKPCFVVNATIQANDSIVMADLAAFDGIWVRERRSAEEAERFGIAAELCGDLSFFHSFPHHDGTERGLVLDSPNPMAIPNIAEIAASLKSDLVAMRHNKKGMKAYKRSWLSWRYNTGKPTELVRGITTFQQFAAFLARRRFLVSARFHGVCFAVNSLVPFSAISSDIWKIDAMLSDIGLERIHRSGQVPKPFAANEIDLISRYLANARRGIAAMFDRVMSSAAPAS